MIFGRKGTINRPFPVSGKFWVTDTGYFIEPRREILEARFLAYWSLRFPFKFYSTDTALPSMTRTDIGSEPIQLPPLSTQGLIADYLDHETAEIDALIEDLDLFGGLLAQRHSAMTSAQFTAASQENNMRPLGTMATFMPGGTPDTAVEDYWADFDTDGAIRWVAISDMSGSDTVTHTAKSLTPLGLAERGLQVAPPGTVLFAMYASVGEVARLATPAAFNQAIIGIRPNLKVLDSIYLQRYLESVRPELLADVRSNTQANLNAHQVRHFVIPTPELSIQQQIAANIQRSLATLRSALSDLSRAITLAKERRAALITAAVTGQIDVTAKHRPAAEQLEDDIKELT